MTKRTTVIGMTATCVALLAGSAMAQDDHSDHAEHKKVQAPVSTPIVGDPYPVDTCPVSGQKLGLMGDPIVKMYEGREVKLCCAGCIEKFDENPTSFIAKIDQQIIEDQMPFYPTQTCVVTGDPLVEGGEDIANNMVYGNRLVRLCCKMCESDFKADPEKYMKKLDLAVADAQRDDYPLTTCLVRGGELGSMGEPVEMVVANRLVKLCCNGCKSKIEADPAKYLKQIDAAWAAKGGLHDAEGSAHDEHASRDKPEAAGHSGHDNGDH